MGIQPKTLVVNFSTRETLTDSGVFLILDPDGNKDSDGNDKTQFFPGDLVALLAIIPSTFRLVSVACTSGTVTQGASGIRSDTTQIFFVDINVRYKLPYIAVGSIAAVWYGNVGSVSLDSATNEVFATSGTPCIGDISYPMHGISLTLAVPPTPVPDEGTTIPIGVVIYVDSI